MLSFLHWLGLYRVQCNNQILTVFPIQDVAVKILKVQGFDSERFEEFLKEVFIMIFIRILSFFFSD